MNKIAEQFAERFAYWDITLASDSLKNRSAGNIKKAGWLIQYCFGQDDKGDYLDFYCAHRMTDDDHTRLYADGTKVELLALAGCRFSVADPDEDKRLEEEFLETNRKVAEELTAKGFDLFTLNMALSAGLAQADKP
ncbi:hypothetical protein CBP31_00015 [Oceanisphaera profunda]|uniref:Uncharacterized protein n=1 Tax=Oceanisphaera profunda TaxID=1416627 RepID=A0A1Y0D1J1_9GAMM|nr:hypothetical protein [Oceanisphaera profunda]ART81214.1 hypothetical protein CBP31_00015 [Oceanisphaera profunda]